MNIMCTVSAETFLYKGDMCIISFICNIWLFSLFAL